ncbi:MAG: antibiotic biosynthesis monooxygenase [Methanocalculaceae archaeon]|jgi:quinol monooxygenase YgiN|nr:antibiotic biosynthesis monooxygenase [Methanocalculaceae archaeon]
MITIVAKGTVKPENADQLIALARDLVATSRTEAGNESYHLMQILPDPAYSPLLKSGKIRRQSF